MIKTNEWSIFELTRYLVEVRSVSYLCSSLNSGLLNLLESLTPDEWTKLKMTAAFSKEASVGGKDQERKQYHAKQLYEPTDALRQLGLPVIDWGQHKWKSSSDQGSWILFAIFHL
jgi:hypothetical protein